MSQATETAATPRLSGREAAIARRQALSTLGKSGLKGSGSGQPAVSNAYTAASKSTASQTNNTASMFSEQASSQQEQSHACSCQHKGNETAGMSETMTSAPISAARQRRMEQSIKGRGNAPASRPAGRVRPAPSKVEEGTTLSGAGVTGNLVERSSRVTGNEQGSCKAITGTEYIGAEQYSKFCDAIPAPAAPKVGVSSTSRGRTVTGTDLGGTQKVTGEESGTCKRITGTEYLSAEQSIEFCGKRPEPGAEKVPKGRTPGGNTMTGGDTSSNGRVTGGSYANPSLRREQEGSLKKPLTSHSSVGSAVRSTLQVQSPSRFDAEASSSSRVTGSHYITEDAFVPVRRAQPNLPPALIGRTRTFTGDSVTGMVIAMSNKLTGDEYRAGKPVTGTASIAAEHIVARDAEEADQVRALSGNVAMHPRATSPEGQVRRSNKLMDEPEIALPQSKGEFAKNMLPMAARERSSGRVTGSSFAGGNLISGSMSRAVGLISGTPEFRFGEGASELKSVPAKSESSASSERLTGEGRERAITGDGWDRGGRVTGTEGQSSSGRNLTLRGTPPAMRKIQQVERPETPEIRVTGSSGVAAKGAVVTLSGGARG